MKISLKTLALPCFGGGAGSNALATLAVFGGLLFSMAGTARAQSVPGFTVTTVANIVKPRGIAIGEAGKVYTLGRDSGELWEIPPVGSPTLVVDLLPGPDVVAGYVGPYFDRASGDLLVSEHLAGDNVLKVTTSGAVSTFASGISLAADITSDADGNIYVGSHPSPGYVLQYNPQGTFLGTYATGLSSPDGLVFSPEGDLLVGNRGTQSIMRIPAGGGAATSISGTIAYPLGVTVDSQGNIYVASYTNGQLYKLPPSGGTPQAIGFGFNGLVGLAFDSQGNLYVAEHNGNRVLKIEAVSPPLNQAPDVSGATPSTALIWPPNNKMVPITINGVTDADGDAVTITITAITNDETNPNTADAAFSGSTAQVKATRNGNGTGRTYTISFTADDGMGGISERSVKVVVPHDQGKRRAKPTAVETATWGEVKNAE